MLTQKCTTMKKIYSVFIIAALFMSMGINAQTGKTAEIKFYQDLDITLDADGSEEAWAEAATQNVDVPADDTSFKWLADKGNLEASTGADDFSATWKGAADTNNLYLLFEVKDDKITRDTNALNGTEKWYEGWDTDKIEIFIRVGNDTVPVSGRTNIDNKCDKGHYQFVLFADEPMIQYSNCPDSVGFSTSTVDYAVKTSALGSYTIEAAISWDSLGIDTMDVSLTHEQSFLFDVNIKDNDNDPGEDDRIPGEPITITGWSSGQNVHSIYHEERPTDDQWDSVPTFGSIVLKDVIVSTPAYTANNEVKIFPNPTTGSVEIQGNVNRVQIYNVLGVMVQETSLESTKNISLEGLSNGIYIMNFFNGQDFVNSTRISKQ